VAFLSGYIFTSQCETENASKKGGTDSIQNKKCFGKEKSLDCNMLVEEMLQKFQQLKCEFKNRFFSFHSGATLPKNLGAVGEEYCERFYQDVEETEMG
jgi:hypothetical protein